MEISIQRFFSLLQMWPIPAVWPCYPGYKAAWRAFQRPKKCMHHFLLKQKDVVFVKAKYGCYYSIFCLSKGFTYFWKIFSSRSLGFHDPIWLIYFSDGLVSTTNDQFLPIKDVGSIVGHEIVDWGQGGWMSRCSWRWVRFPEKKLSIWLRVVAVLWSIYIVGWF